MNSTIRKIIHLDEWSDAEIVESEDGKEVRMSYRQGCHNYALGFSLALFMAAAVLGYVILWQQHIPESLYHTSVPFFVVFSLFGFGIFTVGYLNPVGFYELMEGEPDE